MTAALALRTIGIVSCVALAGCLGSTTTPDPDPPEPPAPDPAGFLDPDATGTVDISAVSLDSAARSTDGLTGTVDNDAGTLSIGDLSGVISDDAGSVALDVRMGRPAGYGLGQPSLREERDDLDRDHSR